MESPSNVQHSVSSEDKDKGDGDLTCKCSDGWKCTITKTDPSKVGKPFYKCGGSCTCVTGCNFTTENRELYGRQSICKCGEGLSCVITKSEGPEADKTYFECGEGCICVIDETNAVKVACL